MKQKLWAIALALCLCVSVCLPVAQAADVCPSTSEVTQILSGLQKQEAYKEGTPWTNATPDGGYGWKGGRIDGTNILAYGCVAFAFQLSDAAFNTLPARVMNNGSFSIADVRPGDILRVNNKAHTVIVVQKTDDAVVLAEANYSDGDHNGKVHWGRTLDATAVNDADCLITRYPEGFVDPTVPGTDEPLEEGSRGNFGDNLQWIITKAGTLSITGKGSMPDFSSVNEQPWKSFSAQILDAKISESVANIGANAFANTSMLSVRIPSTVRSIGANAFSGSKLTSVTIPGTVTTIGDNVFNKCQSLATVSIGEGVEAIGQNAFKGCTTLKSLSIPASVRSVGYAAFMECSEMTTAQFAASANTVALGDNLFTKCYRLAGVTLPKQINSVGEGMFQNCLMLSSVVIPDGAASIGGQAFASCNSLATVTIPVSVTKIGTAAFSPCRSLKEIRYRGTEAQWNAVSKIGDTANTLAGKVTFNNTESPSHEHQWETAWASDNTHHWHNCRAADCNIEQNSGKDSFGAHVYADENDMTCDTCGYTRSPGTSTHTHDWATTWSNDSASHWHDCLAVDCDVTANSGKDGYGAHVYDSDADTTCNTCGYTRTVAPPTPTHTHNWATTWSSDSASHWHECSAPGCDITANSGKDGYEAHIYDSDADATCNTCGYTRTITPPAHTHNWSTAWSSDSAYHWHECSAPGCDVIANSSKDGYGTHVYNSFLDRTCLVCGYNRTDVFDPFPPVTEPTYEPVTPPAPSPAVTPAPSASASATPSSSASASAQPSSAPSSAPSAAPTAHPTAPNPTMAPSAPPDSSAIVPVDPPQGITVPEDSPVQFVEQNKEVTVTGFDAARGSDAPTVRDLLKNIGVQGGTSVTVRDTDGLEVPSAAPLRTGQIATIVQNGEVVLEAAVVVRGDVLGTGEMTLAQVVRLADALRGKSPLEGAFLQAGDFTGSGTVTLTDLVQQVNLYLETARD